MPEMLTYKCWRNEATCYENVCALISIGLDCFERTKRSCDIQVVSSYEKYIVVLRNDENEK